MSRSPAQDLSGEWTVCRSILEEGLNSWNLDFSADQWRQCELFFKELLTWNRTVNMTAVTDPGDFAVKHFLDSLSPLHFASLVRGNVLDLGTGGGFPGIPLKILRPELKFVLIEKSQKKSAFLHTVLGKLAIQGVRILTRRIEETANDPELRGSFETVLARALAKPEAAFRLAAPFLKPGGKFILYSTGRSERRITLPPGFLIKSLPIQLPPTGVDRTLLVFSREANVPRGTIRETPPPD